MNKIQWICQVIWRKRVRIISEKIKLDIEQYKNRNLYAIMTFKLINCKLIRWTLIKILIAFKMIVIIN